METKVKKSSPIFIMHTLPKPQKVTLQLRDSKFFCLIDEHIFVSFSFT